MLDSDSTELLAHLQGTTGFQAAALNTGGGVIVAAVDLSIDARFLGRQIWLTRDGEDDWLLGFYDFATDEEDEGIVVALNIQRRYMDNPGYIAAQVAGILQRLGITDTSHLQGA